MKKLLFIFALFALDWLVSAQCPSNCNGHGVCDTETNLCLCQGNWRGHDCSVLITPLTSNIEVRGNVQFRSWAYYSFDNPTGAAFKITLAQSGSGDADMYVRKKDLPTLSQYDYIDVSLDRISVLDIPRTGTPTTWYVGIFGFTSTDFTIKLEQSSTACLDDCNRNGRCVNGQCICDIGYGGPSCGNAVTDVTENNWNSATVRSNEWKYYKYRVSGTSNFLRIDVEQRPTPGADVDLFIRKDKLPSTTEWDYADAGVKLNYSITVTQPTSGDWYIGFYGFGPETVFQFKVASGAAACPSKCSKHGDCRGTTCSCYPDYSGQTCNTLNRNLRRNEVVAGYVEGNGWNFYKFQTNTGNNFIIEMWHQEGDPSQDCDVYVNPDIPPTRFRYQYRDTSRDLHFTLRIDNPSDQTWHIGIFGFTSCNYNMTVYESSTCPGNCGGKGSCEQGRCICYEGWAGDDCNIQVTTITTNGGTLTGTIVQNEWKYYKFVGTHSALNTLIKEETASNGVLWLFVSLNTYPSLAGSDFSDTHPYSPIHKISINWGREVHTTYYIGVYGSPYVEHPTRYTLTAWEPPF